MADVRAHHRRPKECTVIDLLGLRDDISRDLSGLGVESQTARHEHETVGLDALAEGRGTTQHSRSTTVCVSAGAQTIERHSYASIDDANSA